MQAVHACATAKGVEMPPPPTTGQKAPHKGDKRGPHGPKLTEAERAIVDACFAEQGIEPPKGPPLGGKRGPGVPPAPPTE